MPPKYDNALLEGRELTQEPRTFRPTLFRDEIVAAVAKSIAARRSVLLVGPSGVGKTKIVQGLALHLAQTGPRKLYELSAVQLLSGTVYLGEWQSKVTAIFDARESEPLRLADGQKIGREALEAMLAAAQAHLEAIASGIGLLGGAGLPDALFEIRPAPSLITGSWLRSSHRRG